MHVPYLVCFGTCTYLEHTGTYTLPRHAFVGHQVMHTTVPNFKVWLYKNLFCGNITLDQHFFANLKKLLFAKLWTNFLLFLFLSFLAQNMFNKPFSNGIWSAQHPNAGQNIQQAITCRSENVETKKLRMSKLT